MGTNALLKRIDANGEGRGRSLRVGLSGLFACAWAVSLFVPVVRDTHVAGFRGYVALLAGWLAIFSFQFGWFANPVLGFALVRLVGGRPGARLDMVVALALLLLAFDACFWSRMYGDGRPIAFDQFGPGYVLWLFATCGAGITLLISAAMRWRSERDLGLEM